MRLHEVLTVAQAQVYEVTNWSILDREVRVAFGADLMSDVLRYDVAQGLLITGLVNPQIVRTAEMADVSAILMVRGKRPLPETGKLAGQIDIPILGTNLTMFEACGRLYQAGLRAATRCDELT